MPQIPNSKKRLNNNSLTPEKKNKGKMKSLIRQQNMGLKRISKCRPAPMQDYNYNEMATPANKSYNQNVSYEEQCMTIQKEIQNTPISFNRVISQKHDACNEEIEINSVFKEDSRR